MMDRFRDIQKANDNILSLEAELAQLQRELMREHRAELPPRGKPLKYRPHYREQRREARSNWGYGGARRVLKVTKRPPRPGQLTLSSKAKHQAVEGYVVLMMAEMPKQAKQGKQAEQRKGGLALEWQVLKKMRQAGFTSSQITHALRQVSIVLGERKGAGATKYIKRVTSKLAQQQAKQSPELCRRQRQDVRKVIGEFREYRDRERGKPPRGAFPSKETDVRMLRLQQRWQVLKRQSEERDSRARGNPVLAQRRAAVETVSPSLVPVQSTRSGKRAASQTHQSASGVRGKGSSASSPVQSAKEHQGSPQAAAKMCEAGGEGGQQMNAEKRHLVSDSVKSDNDEVRQRNSHCHTVEHHGLSP
jgi:hypothetical protein